MVELEGIVRFFQQKVAKFFHQILLKIFLSRLRSRLNFFHRDHEVLVNEATIG